MSPHVVLGLLIGVAVLVRLPLLPHGFGLDPDAVRNVLVAERLMTEGVYLYSRPPGYPVHEFLLAGTHAYTSPLFANGISLIAFILSALILHCILRRIAPETALAYTATYLFLPLGLVASTEAMDYYLALLFVLMSILWAAQKNSTLSAIALGAAVGTRLTSGAAVLAVLPYLRFNRLTLFFAIFIVSAFIFYAPVLWVYGASFFTFFDGFPRPGATEILYGGMVLTWGALGSIAVLFVMACAGWKVLKGHVMMNNPFLLSGVALITLYWIAFFRLPHEAEYLLPTVVGILLVASVSIQSPRIAWIMTISVAISSAVSIGPNGVSPGFWKPYLEARILREEQTTCVSRPLRNLPNKSTIIVPTSVDHAYLSQRVYSARPDLTFLISGLDPLPPNTQANVFNLATSITVPSNQDCTAKLTPRE